MDMKTYVNKMPIEPKDCLFVNKELAYTTIYDVGGKNEKKEFYRYFCNVNGKLCDVDCGGKCNKLKALT